MDYNRKLKRLLDSKKFKSSHILNFDEKGFLIGLGAKVVVLCRSNRRNPRLLQDGKRELITVVETIAADGTALPPFIIFKGKSHTQGMYQFTRSLFPGCRIAYSEKGYMTSTLSEIFIVEHLSQHLDLDDGEPRLLVMDGHTTHITYNFLKYCLDRNIFPIVIPSHTSHLLQPLDVGCFGPYAKKYSQALDNYVLTHLTEDYIGREDFFPILALCREEALTKHNIIKAFEATGIVPFNQRIVVER
ncbi:CENP-B protein, partial [Ascobolus immersus RN42]